MIDYSALKDAVTDQDLQVLRQSGATLPKYPTADSGKYLILYGILALLVMVLLGWRSFDGTYQTFVVFTGILLIFVGSIQLLALRRLSLRFQRHLSKISTFAQRNGMELRIGEKDYQPSKTLSSTGGYTQRSIYRILPYAGASYEVGFYRVHTETIQRVFVDHVLHLKVTLESSLPRIMLSHKATEIKSFGHVITGFPTAQVNNNLLTIGEPFDSRYGVYALPESATAVHSLLTPELKALLDTDTFIFAIEVLDTELYVRAAYTENNLAEVLQRLFEIGEAVPGKKSS